MPEINQLTAVSSVVGSDQIPIYSSSNGDARKASVTTLTDYVKTVITAEYVTELTAAVDGFITQYAAPAATGFNINVTTDTDGTWLIVTPAAGYAAGTITLPSTANCYDRQELLVNCTQAVTTLTVAGNGSNVVGAPTTLAAGDFFRIRFDFVMSTWYRVG